MTGTALTPAGMPGAIATPAPGRTPTTRKLVDEHWRRSGYQSSFGELLDAIYERKSFRQVLRDLNLTPNRVWGLTKTDEERATALDAALTATRRDDLEHGTNAAYVHGCVCGGCREHQRVRMAQNRKPLNAI